MIFEPRRRHQGGTVHSFASISISTPQIQAQAYQAFVTPLQMQYEIIHVAPITITTGKYEISNQYKSKLIKRNQ